MNDPHLSGPPRPSVQVNPMGQIPGVLRPPVPQPIAHKPPVVEELVPLSIVDDMQDASDAISQFRATIKAQSTEREFKRKTSVTGHGAVHVKSFHGRLSDDGMQRFDDRVNDWLESHPEVEVKFATTTIATWDGKTKEEAIVVNIWY